MKKVIKRKEIIVAICALALLVVAISIVFVVRFPLIEEKDTNIPDPEKALLEAESIALKESQILGQLPIEESKNDGYWWIKQGDDMKLSYVKSLIKEFELGDKKLTPEKIIEKLDSFYNPKDNPLGIKMDISIERALKDVL